MEAERACTNGRGGPFSEVLFCSQSAVKKLNGKAENAFGHIFLYFQPEVSNFTTSTKKNL